MHIDLKAITKGYATFLCIYLPVYLPHISNTSIAKIFSLFAPFLPYAAVFIGGVTLAYCARINTRLNSIVITLLISATLGLANYFGPTDFPGITATAWIIGISLPIVIFLVLAGQAAKELLTRKKTNKKRL